MSFTAISNGPACHQQTLKENRKEMRLKDDARTGKQKTVDHLVLVFLFLRADGMYALQVAV